MANYKDLPPLPDNASEEIRFSRALALALRTARNAAGLTQADAAARVGVATSHLAGWEIEVATPSSFNLWKIARGLGVSTDYLLGLGSREPREVVQAAYDLMVFFRKNLAPDEAWDEGREDEWAVDIVTDDDALAEELADTMDRLEAELLAIGWDTFTGETPKPGFEGDDPVPSAVF